MRKFLGMAALGAAFLLAGCSGSTPPLTQIDQTIASQNVQTGIEFACLGLQGAKAGWDVWAGQHKVSDADKQKAEAAYAGVTQVCTPPYPQNTADVVAKVVAATVAVIGALHAEQAAPTVAAGSS